MKLAIFGYGGHAKEVAVQINKSITFFVDDEYSNEKTLPISSFNPYEFKLIVAVTNPIERKKIVERLPKETTYFTFIHPSAQIFDDIQIGEGSFIGANCILTTNIILGSHTILNRGNQIGHDSIIGDYFSAMPGAIVSGNVNISDCVYMGNNSSVKEKTSIIENVTIGSNCTVVKNITKPGVYVGVPAKFLKDLNGPRV
jgi:sugar O-acyltransferase (sialic acid O-acetyltransferase NeuD family)